MQIEFSLYIKRLKRGGKIALFSLSFILASQINAFGWDDAPYERNFKRIPRYIDSEDKYISRWIWLNKVGDHNTQIIVGRGAKQARNAITIMPRSNDMIDCWDYAYFVKLTKQHYFLNDSNNALYFAIVPLDITNVLIRTAIIFKLQNENITEIARIPDYECYKDLPLFADRAKLCDKIDACDQIQQNSKTARPNNKSAT